MVGILALQGDFREHEEILQKLNVPTIQVRLPEHLEKIDRLIIPGGESTTIGKLLLHFGLLQPIRERATKGMPVWGTCAGAILLAKHIGEGKKEGQPTLALVDITVHRNAFGRQIDSFETELMLPTIDTNPFHVIFIRAPKLSDPGKGVEVLGQLDTNQIVAVKQNNILATSFHSELATDTRIHEYFLRL